LFAASTIYNLKVIREEKPQTHFIITHYRESAFGIEGGTALHAFRNTVNTKTPIVVVRKSKHFLLI
jgi:hypothetical protein